MAIETENNESINIVNKWLIKIYDGLNKLQYYGDMAGESAEDLVTYFQEMNISTSQAEIQFKSLRYMINEFENVLINSQIKINDTFYKFCKIKVDGWRKCINLGRNKYIITPRNDVSHLAQSSYLTPEYWKLFDDINKLKEKVIKKLSPILFGETEEIEEIQERLR